MKRERDRERERGRVASKEVNVASAILRGGSCFQRSQPASAIRDPTPPQPLMTKSDATGDQEYVPRTRNACCRNAARASFFDFSRTL
jgi:hypothetical protein